MLCLKLTPGPQKARWLLLVSLWDEGTAAVLALWFFFLNFLVFAVRTFAFAVFSALTIISALTIFAFTVGIVAISHIVLLIVF